MAGPTWYDDNYLYRAPIVVDGSATAAGIVDAQLALQNSHPFWLTVQSTGFDVRFTTSDGMTPLAYNRAAWDYANKSATFNIDGVVHFVTNTMTVIWMYWGYAAATDGSTSPTIGATLNAYIESNGILGDVFEIENGSAAATTPRNQRQKQSGDIIGVTWRLPLLSRRTIPWEGRLDYEGPTTLVLAETGTFTYNTNDLRLVLDRDQLYVTTLLEAGADGDVEDITCTVYTTLARKLIGIGRITVEDY